MKNRECAIVQDLLVLYEDGMLQEESMQMIEEHIRGCEECMKIYENTGKELSISCEVTEQTEAEQEDAAVAIMKKLKKRITRKNKIILSVILTLLLVAVLAADSICQHLSGGYWGIVDMIYRIPSDRVEVTQIYQLKNGDIYCELRSDKKIGIQSASDWILPDYAYEKSTEDARLEISFRQVTPWESGNVPEMYRLAAVFATQRKGTVVETDKEITQYCREIIYRGKTEKDCLVIWERGQKVEEAPEDIERKVIVEYIRDRQIDKAIQECESLGWDSNKMIAEICGESQGYIQYGSADGEESVNFLLNYDTILINNIDIQY